MLYALIFILSIAQAHVLSERSPFVARRIHLTAEQKSTSERFLGLFDNQCLQKHSVIVKHKISLAMPVQAYSFFPSELTSELTTHPCLLGLTVDGRTQASGLPNDPQLVNQTYLQSIGFAPSQSDIWDSPERIVSGVTVAVIDSGVQLNHPDLRNQFWRAVDNSIGFDFIRNNTSPEDGYGHGTHVAGLIAAQTNNGIGIAAIARNARLMILRTQDDTGAGQISDMTNAIRWATDHGAEVINISIDGAGENPALLDALLYAADHNVVVVVAAGNQAMEVNTTNFFVPVGYAGQIKGMFGVGAFDANDFSRANFSNYSTTNVKISSPGTIGLAGLLSTYLNSSYQAFQGTSMSSPLMAAAVSLSIGFLKTRGLPVTSPLIEDVFSIGSIEDPALVTVFDHGRRLDLPTLMKALTHSYYFDGTGGFDETP